MVLSKATGYGIRALLYLASQPQSRLCGLEEIASREQIPPVFLRKVLGELRRRRLLRSAKGIHGGYGLARSANQITIWDVVQSLESDPGFDQCVLGRGYCSSENACPLHADWHKLREQLILSWQMKTLSEVLLARPAR